MVEVLPSYELVARRVESRADAIDDLLFCSTRHLELWQQEIAGWLTEEIVAERRSEIEDFWNEFFA